METKSVRRKVLVGKLVDKSNIAATSVAARGCMQSIDSRHGTLRAAPSLGTSSYWEHGWGFDGNGRNDARATAMSNQARVANTGLWVLIALYVLLGVARLLHNTHLQRLTPFISVAILMGFAIVHGMRRYGSRHFVVFFFLTF